MKKLLVVLACWVGAAFAQTSTTVVTNPTFYDDTNVHVPLQFGFPFFGRTFTNSWMHSNGVVSFLDPTAPIPNAPNNPGAWAYCCEGMNLVPQNTQLGPQFNYMIAPLWTDLYPVGSSTFRTEGTTTYQRYFWNNIAEISNQSNLNTFSLEIRPTGFIGATYNQVNIHNQNVTAGITGDISLGQMQQFYFGRGVPTQGLSGWAINSTPGDMCTINPLSSPTCAGYTEAMCSSNPLYSTSCSGYQQAYLSQQCSINTLHSPSCPGYAQAYLNYQCSLSPLYSTTCAGYETAYFNQQCSLNALYNSRCPGYEAAYLNQQCSLNALYSTSCAGYADAYFVQQCSLNPLYNVGCTGYAQAYFNQQCSLNGLYDRTCPNYSEAYAKKMLLENQGIASTVATAGVVAANAPSPSPVSSEGTVSTAPSATGSAVVDRALPPPATSATAAAPAAPVQLVQPAPAPPAPAPQQAKNDGGGEQKPAEAGPSNQGGGGQQTAQGGQQGGDKPQQPTTRQALAERRLEAARREAVEKGKNLANDVGKATSIEAQKQLQNVVIQAMGFTPGFDAYAQVFVPDAAGYKPVTVYNNQRNVDNARLGRGLFGPTDRLHNDLVELQHR